MKPLTIEEVKATVKFLDFIWVYVWGDHYDNNFDDVFCFQVQNISDSMIEPRVIWDEFCLYFCEYGKTWLVFPDNPTDYIADLPI